MKKIIEIDHWTELKNEVIHGDCFEGMAKIPDKSINLIIFDPPYFEVKGDFDFKFKDRNEWIELNRNCAIEFKRILADNGSLYVFGHAKKIAYQQMAYDEYFKLENSLIWEKVECQTNRGYETFRSYMPVTERILFYSNEIVNINGLCVNNCRDYLRSEIERAKGKIIFKEVNQALGTADNGGGIASAVLSLNKEVPAMITKEYYEKLRAWLNERKEYEYLRKEYEDLRRPWSNEKRLTDVLKYSQEANITKKFQHPTQKPPKLLEDLIMCSSRKGDIILDPMSGSFSTARASKDLGRDFIGFELEKEYCEIGEKRLEQGVLF